MKVEKEIEVKYLLNKKDFDFLKEKLLEKSEIIKIQTNYYFDTKNHDLINNGISFRIREHSDLFKATLKIRKEEQNDEINMEISKEDFKSLLSNIITNNISILLQNININHNDIINIGKLSTKRIKTKYLDGILFFDENYYQEIIDYEVEYEVNSSLNEADYIMKQLFEKYNISYKKSTGKINRAIKKVSL